MKRKLSEDRQVPIGDEQFSNMTDQDFLVHRARTMRSEDPYCSKSWMLTAKSLFPDNFSIQFEAYRLFCFHRNSGVNIWQNIVVSARL